MLYCRQDTCGGWIPIHLLLPSLVRLRSQLLCSTRVDANAGIDSRSAMRPTSNRHCSTCKHVQQLDISLL